MAEKFDIEQYAFEDEPTPDGLGLVVKRKTLFHGSATPDIDIFNTAEEDTVGTGLYLTSEEKDAAGYAQRRLKNKKDGKPIIYETKIEDLKILDLRNRENVRIVLAGFKKILEEKIKNPELTWMRAEVIRAAIENINLNKIGSGNLKEIAFSLGKDFTEYCQSLGYDGLITFEGGEGDEVGDHDTYLIFDPTKAKIVQQKTLES